MSKFNTLHELLNHTYFEAIRHVVIVDDQYPSYEQTQESKEDSRYLFEDAARLWQEFRSRGWPCDIANKCHLDDREQEILSNTDLIVLDYHLVGDSQDPRPALRLLNHLSTSPHFNIVALYTGAENLNEVHRSIAVYLRGVTNPTASLPNEHISDWEYASEEAPRPTFESTINYIRGMASGEHGWKTDTQLRGHFRQAGLPNEHGNLFIAAHFESILTGIYTSLDGEVERPIRDVAMSNPNADPMWIECGNVFIVIIPKSEKQIIPSIEKAIFDWNPPALQVALSLTRNILVKGGLDYERQVLNDSVLHTSLLFHALSGSAEEQTDRISDLIESLFERLHRTIELDLREAVPLLFPQDVSEGFNPLQSAKELSRISTLPIPSEHEFVHAINEFLSTENYTHRAITTGTVFCGEGNVGAEDEYFFICVTPACDMVPREASDDRSWAKSLYPFRPMTVIRARCLDDYTTALKKATTGRYLFIKFKGKRIALELIDYVTRSVRLETLLAVNLAITSEGEFWAFRVTAEDEGTPGEGSNAGEETELIEEAATGDLPQLHAPNHRPPRLKQEKFTVVAQMRRGYANRLLHESGFHASRMGVDYVNL